MSKSFTHYFKSFTFARAIETEQETLQKNRHYQALQTNLETLHQDLLAALPAQAQPLLASYLDIQTQKDTLLSSALYRRGLKDGLRLAILLLKTGIMN